MLDVCVEIYMIDFLYQGFLFQIASLGFGRQQF